MDDNLLTIFMHELCCDQVSQYHSSILWNRYVGQVDVSDNGAHSEIRKGRPFLSFFPFVKLRKCSFQHCTVA